jgi:predicted dehydrogenase
VIYRVGVAGAGFGEKAHVAAFKAHPSFEVVAIASPNSASRVAREHKLKHAFKNVAEMVEHAELDVVSIASPPFAHHADVLAALQAQKHVLCEKPFTLNVTQAEELVAAAAAARTACGVMHEFRWVPQRLALRELIANRHLHLLREVEITQLTGTLRQSSDRKNNWWFEKSKGGGLAGALLSHLIDTSNWLVGRYPIRSTGYIRTANPQRHDATGHFTSTVDDGAFALIDYGDGVIGRVSADATCAVSSVTIAAHGENRTAVASGADMIENQLFSIDEDETSELQCAPMKYARFESVHPNVLLVMELLDELVKQIESASSALPTFEDAFQTQRVLESIGYRA